MITVKIEINGRKIYRRDAVNVGGSVGVGEYRVNEHDKLVLHQQSDGAIELARKLLALPPTADYLEYQREREEDIRKARRFIEEQKGRTK